MSIIVISIGAVLGTPALAHGEEAHTIRFENGRWWNGSEFVRRTVVVERGQFVDRPRSEIEGTVDLAGGYVVPPLADAHRHLFLGQEGQAKSDASLRGGVFYVKDPHAVKSMTDPAADRINRPTAIDVTHAFAGFTSPGGHPTQLFRVEGHGGARALESTGCFQIEDESGLAARWDAALATGTDFVKVYLDHSEEHEARRADPAFVGKRGLDPALVKPIVARAHAAGKTVSAHVTTAVDFRAAVRAGVDEINHLPLQAIAREDAAAAARAGITVVTTLLSHRPGGHGAAVERIHRDNLALLRGAGVRVVLGTDNNQKTVVDELVAFARLTDATPGELLQLATVTTAQWVAPERRIGCLNEGCEASFLVLDRDPREDLERLAAARVVVKQGRMLDLGEADAERKGIASELMRFLHQGDLDGAVRRYRELYRDQREAWNFGEAQLNDLGYGSLQHGRADVAVRLFELNAETFPRSANAQDSLAEGCEAAGRVDCARAASRSTLELLESSPHDPTAELRRLLEKNARERLARLERAGE